MNKHIIELLLNKDEKIIIEPEDQLTEIDCCYDAPVSLIKNHHKTLLSYGALDNSMYQLSSLLTKALSNGLSLHKSITNNIGYMYNQYSPYICSGNPHIDNLFVCKKIESSSVWIGTQHLLWENNNFMSWLYTDTTGTIVFEVTPFYPFMYSDTKKKLHYISFESWMKRYKPYLISIIPKETAHKWITQANCITQQIEANINRWKQEEKNHNL